MKQIVIKTLTIIAVMSFTMACESKKGSLEKAGERADEIIDNVKDGDPILHKKGPVEKAGEAIDETVKDMTDGK